MTTAAPQGNEIRASEDPRAILRPTSVQIRHDQAKFDQPRNRHPRPTYNDHKFDAKQIFPDTAPQPKC